MKINREYVKKHNFENKHKANIHSSQLVKSSFEFENEDKSFKSHNNLIALSNVSIKREKHLHADEKNRVTDEVYISSGNKIDGKFHADFDYSPDKVVFEPAAKLEEESTVGIGYGKEINLPQGGHVRGKLEAGLQANADVGAAARFKLEKDNIDVGFSIGDRLELGTYEGVSIDARTHNGSGVNMAVKLEQGPQLGGAIGAGIKIDKKGIHCNLELDGNFGLFGTDLKGKFDIQYADVKHMVNVVASGPIGMAVSYVFKETSEIIGKIKDKIHHKNTASSEVNKEASPDENKKTPGLENKEAQATSGENKEVPVSEISQEPQWQLSGL